MATHERKKVRLVNIELSKELVRNRWLLEILPAAVEEFVHHFMVSVLDPVFNFALVLNNVEARILEVMPYRKFSKLLG